jgi:signal transduction histidine kinase
VIIVAGAGQARVPDGVEDRMGEFTELVATAIANAESREELRASRARVVTAADDARRRIERDLHDGTQQRLIALGLELRAAEDMAPSEMDELRARLSVTVAGLTDVTEELRELSRGIHPAILSRGGLRAALSALARRSPVPVELDVSTTGRLPDHVEVAAYYVVSEALTNAVKHADASHVSVEVGELDGSVVLSIRDDGMGGADPRRGSGLIGLRDRVEALGGTLELSSPAGAGTTLHVTFPSA